MSITTTGSLPLDAEALYVALRDGVRPWADESVKLVGITSGGAWLAERLHRDWQRAGEPGVISSSLHRDDFSRRGLSYGGKTRLPFDVEGAEILLLDDVIHTGRTLRAVLNELFDYGRPARVRLAVLVDRGGRELPIQPDFAAASVVLGPSMKLALDRGEQGQFRFRIAEA